jgi:DnaJ-class molecular chaperone
MNCPNCNGEGQVAVLDGYNEYGEAEISGEKCEYCEGSGEIKR